MAETAREFFEGLKEGLDLEKIKGINATYQWDLGDAGKWNVAISDDGIEAAEGEAEASDITITCSESDWVDIVNGKLNGQTAFLTGKLQIKGDMSLAMKLQSFTS